MKKNQFTNFDYEIITSSSTGKKEVKVSYQFNNKQCRKYLLVDESKKLNDSEYIEIAKEQIEESIKNGQLAKYSKQFTFSVHFGVIPTVIASVAGVAAITCASLFAWKAVTGGGGGGDDPGPVPPTPSGETEIVEFFNEDGTLLKREKVTKGDKVTKPEDPTTTDGYFANWYTEPTFENIYDFDTDVEGDLKLYPKFAKKLLSINYLPKSATTASVPAEIKFKIDANQDEEMFVNWEGDKVERITNFSDVSHTYTDTTVSFTTTTIYGQPDAISLASVDSSSPWITHLFTDSNAYIDSIELFQDMKDTTKSSCMGGLDSNGNPSKIGVPIIHNGVTYIPNHFLCSSSILDWPLCEKGLFADTVTNIGDYAYANNTKTKEAIIRDSVQHIGKGAFQNCTNLNHVRTGRYLKSVADDAFSNTSPAGLEFFVDELSFECSRTGEYPSFGAQTIAEGKFTKFYCSVFENVEEFVAELSKKNWLINPDKSTWYNCIIAESYTEQTSKHTYKINNTRYPLIETRTQEAKYIYESPWTSPQGSGWIAEIKCTDDVKADTSESALNCNVDGSKIERSLEIKWGGRTMPHTDIELLNSELGAEREFVTHSMPFIIAEKY